MFIDMEKAICLEQNDVFDYTLDPNLSGAGWKVENDGPKDANYVKLTGFGFGDPTIVKAKVGANLSPKVVNLPGADPNTPEQIAYKESFLFTVNSSGEKITLGQFRIVVSPDPFPV